MTPLVLELENVTKVYPGPPPVWALSGVSLAVAEGDLVAVTGPSGSGKSTLLHLAGALDMPTTGSVRVTGLDIARLTDRSLSRLRATRIGFVFQQLFLAEHQSVLDNVADGLLYAGVPLPRRRERAMRALTRVGLAGRAGVRPTQLSGGQRQRVAIARALAGEPAVVFADEPTGSLDQATGQAVLDLIDQLNHAGTTFVLITHDPAVADRARRQVHILDGQITADSAMLALTPGRPR
jgi:putative ABC transport system ATP-binding protein